MNVKYQSIFKMCFNDHENIQIMRKKRKTVL